MYAYFIGFGDSNPIISNTRTEEAEWRGKKRKNGKNAKQRIEKYFESECIWYIHTICQIIMSANGYTSYLMLVDIESDMNDKYLSIFIFFWYIEYIVIWVKYNIIL